MNTALVPVFVALPLYFGRKMCEHPVDEGLIGVGGGGGEGGGNHREAARAKVLLEGTFIVCEFRSWRT